MLLNESTQTENERQSRAFRERVLKEGMALWKKQQECERQKKLHEQREMREMLDKYWPFGKATSMKPRGLRNLRLEGLFPNQDYINAKRFVGPLGLGRPGGGAPIISEGGRRITRTKEDPLLRFQFSKDLRNTVDNTLRYKKNNDEKEAYRKQLDKQVEEKKQKQLHDKQEKLKFYKDQFRKSSPWGKRGPGGLQWRSPSKIGFNFIKSLGWSNEHTLKHLDNEAKKNKENVRKEYDKFRKLKMVPPNKITKLEPIIYPTNFVTNGLGKKKLSSLCDSHKEDEGVELVTLLSKQRNHPIKIPLCTTDATNNRKLRCNYTNIWNREGSSHLKQLGRQIYEKQQLIQNLRAKDQEFENNHFYTMDSLWGRPGHGAPRDIVKKQCLDHLLYPQMIPINVC